MRVSCVQTGKFCLYPGALFQRLAESPGKISIAGGCGPTEEAPDIVPMLLEATMLCLS
jgi:hypothetical protein